MTVLAPELTWTGERFERNVRVEIDGPRIRAVGGAGGGEAMRLDRRALLPGFVNAHSHAFQRGLRGHGETFPSGAGSFWTWREAMYRLVSELTWKGFRDLCVRAFREMRRAGITTVGEFHYLHHAKADDYALDPIVLDAAAEAGIRIVLLNAYYATGGIGKALEGAQLRFRTKTPSEYWARMDALRVDDEMQRLGAVVHSVRAAAPEDLADVHREAKRRGLAFHIHLEEQPLEIEQCVKAYGRRPMQLVLDRCEVDARTTAVHCTHTDANDMMIWRGCGARMCACPLTEANLGDGLPALTGPAALGTDSNARISMLEEMRWLEYGQRLKTLTRGALKCCGAWLHAATAEGADALGVPAGRIAKDCYADFVAVDLDAPTLEGWTDDTLLDALLTGCAEEAIAATCVGGEWQDVRVP